MAIPQSDLEDFIEVFIEDLEREEYYARPEEITIKRDDGYAICLEWFGLTQIFIYDDSFC